MKDSFSGIKNLFPGTKDLLLGTKGGIRLSSVRYRSWSLLVRNWLPYLTCVLMSRTLNQESFHIKSGFYFTG
jgi:hypothetical protein